MTSVGAVDVEPPPVDDAPGRTGRAASRRSAAIVMVATTTLLVCLADWHSPIRTALALAFLFFGPGLALVELLGIQDLAMRVAIATGASLALDTIVAVALVYAGRFSPDLALVLLVALTVVIALWAGIRALHQGPSSPHASPRP